MNGMQTNTSKCFGEWVASRRLRINSVRAIARGHGGYGFGGLHAQTPVCSQTGERMIAKTNASRTGACELANKLTFELSVISRHCT